MQLSLGILVYQLDPEPLVDQLKLQLRSLNLEAEIIIYDDGSGEDQQVLLMDNFEQDALIKLVLAGKNLGRAAARNRLAAHCQGEYLMMIDGDAQIDNANFVASYWNAAQKGGVVVGGKKLSTTKPLKHCELRFKYAKNREIRESDRDAKSNFQSFQTNCFLIDTEAFNLAQFDENLKGYGHEDSLFGLMLKKAGYKLVIIDMPSLYPADENSIDFLKKTDQALANLLYIQKAYPEFRQSFPLLKLCQKLEALKLKLLVGVILQMARKPLKQNLLSSKPSLGFFDLYRLLRLLELDRINKGA